MIIYHSAIFGISANLNGSDFRICCNYSKKQFIRIYAKTDEVQFGFGQETIRLNQVGGSITMTTFKKSLGLGMMLAAFAIAGAVPAFAQGCDDVTGYTDLYNKILENYQKPDIATKELTVATSKEYLEKFGSCPAASDGTAHPAKAGVDWVKVQLPGWEQSLKALKDGAIIEKLYAKYVAELGASKWDEAIATSKELLAVFPQDKNLNIIIPLASIGLYESYKKNDKFVDVSIQNAKIALDKMKAGEVALKDYYGIAPYIYGNKADAMSEMKFILGYMAYEKKNDQKGGLAYFYDVANSPGLKKTDPRMFVTVGLYALDQAKPVVAELTALATKLNAADEEIKKPETTEERKKELSQQKIDLDKQIIAKEGYLKAWEERALDGFVRAYKNAKDVTPAEKEYRQNIYKQITQIYESRFPTNKAGLDSYIASTVAKPMVNPTTDITPVAVPAETTTGGASAVVAKPEPSTAPARTVAATQPAATKTTAKAKPRK